MKYVAGIDFGTYQSKVCIHNIEKKSFEFLFFEESNSVFLPSTVSVVNDTPIYGVNHEESKGHFYDYFKMASAEDIEFHKQTFDSASEAPKLYNEVYSTSDLKPEFLSIIYLCNLIFLIEDKINRLQIYREKGRFFGGLIGGLVRNKNNEEAEIIFNIGMPTEWTASIQIEREKKFRSILLLARELHDSFESFKDFKIASLNSLLKSVRKVYSSIKELNFTEVKELMESKMLGVRAENAAGISALVFSGQLQPATYSAIDIGGGSSDISFFTVTRNKKIKYIASESYLMASNNIFESYRINSKSDKTFTEIQSQFKSLVTDNRDLISDEVSALSEINKSLTSLHKKLFVKRVKGFHPKMLPSVKNQKIIIYGGGSLFPIINEGEMVIFSNGNFSSLNIEVSKMYKSIISNFNFSALKINNLNEVQNSMNILFVALGLSSFIHSDNDTWFDDSDYNPLDNGSRKTPDLIAHPFNQDCYIINPLK